MSIKEIMQFTLFFVSNPVSLIPRGLKRLKLLCLFWFIMKLNNTVVAYK